MMKRLLNKKGSVLFLVVVVMSILIVAASATFYIVNNQQSSVNVRYSSEQSYQTAVSVSDSVANYLKGYVKAMNGKSKKDYENTILGKMFNGELIRTENYDLGTGLGTVDEIEIKRSSITVPADDITTSNIFEIKVTATVNGETSSITKLINIKTGVADYFTRFLTCTGESNEDVIISAFSIYGDLYFENEYTILGNPTRLNNNMYCSSTLENQGLQFANDSIDYQMVIGKNYVINSAAGGGKTASYIFVGGNFEHNVNQAIQSKEVYVMGNCILGSDQGTNSTKYFVNKDLYISNSGTKNCTFYVNGDLHLGREAVPEMGIAKGAWHNQGTFYVNGDVYIHSSEGAISGNIICGGEVKLGLKPAKLTEHKADDVTSAINQAFTTSSFNSGKPIDDQLLNWETAESYIDFTTTKNVYSPWKAEKYVNKMTGLKTINLNNWDSYLGTNYIQTVEVGEKADGTKLYGDYFYINENFILESFTNGEAIANKNIIIDASSSNIYVYLKGEVDESGKKVFNFGFSGSNQTNILINGEYAVIFVLPDDTEFVMNSHMVIGHLNFILPFIGESEFKAIFRENGDAVVVENLFDKISKQKDNVKTFLETKIFNGRSVNIINRTKAKGAHNNIFLVTTGDKNNISFNAESTFCGYIYAPLTTLDANGSNSSFTFFGGLIVGGYTYTNISGTLTFTTPYDYGGKIAPGNPIGIVQKLMDEANLGSGEPDNTGDEKTIKGYDFNIGYK